MTASTLASGAPRGMAPAGGFPQDHPWDRNFFLTWVLLIWLGILMGFVPEMVRHVTAHGKPYPAIIHVHGVLFVGWLALLTTQVLLIRSGATALHRRLGAVAVALYAAMLVVGPATAFVMHGLEFGTPDSDAGFLIVQLTDIASFGVLAGAGILLRNSASAHKRLMLMGTIYISDAGFARWLGGDVAELLGRFRGAYMASLYIGPDALLLGLGVYDLVTRRRLHPAYVAGLAWIGIIQIASAHIKWEPAWKVIATHLIGH